MLRSSGPGAKLSMKWSMRVALMVAGAFVLFVTLSVSIQRWIVYPQFQALEAQDVKRATDRLVAAMDRESAKLAGFIADYAEWDDAWAFAADLNPEFIRSNFALNAFQRENFHMVWIIGVDGKLLYRAIYNVERDALDETFDLEGEQLLEGHPFLKPLSGTSLAGIIPTAQGAALVAAHPILTSDGSGPPRGIMVMGRRIGPEFVQSLSEQLQLPVEQGLLLSWYGRLQPGVPFHRRLASGTLETAVQWNDLFGKPGLVLTMNMPPDITAVGRRALFQSVLALLAQGVLFLAIGGLVLQRSLQRSHKAELANQLEERTATLRETEHYLKTIMDTVPVGIFIADAQSHTLLDANPAALTLINARREDVLGQNGQKFLGATETVALSIEGQKRNEQVLTRLDGSTLPVLKTVVPTHLRGQNCLLECFVDIRDQKAAEEKIRQTVEDMGRLNRAMIGREERVLELKHEVNLLLQELGRAARYREGSRLTSAGDTVA